MPFSPLRRFFHATSGRLLLPAILVMAMRVAPAAAQGSSDIFLLRVTQADGLLTVENITRITNRDGYNNQPAFLRDNTLLYTAVSVAGPEGQADIWMARATPGMNQSFTNTKPESEYSAYHMPGVDRISVIRVEADSQQRLWSFNRAGLDPQLVLKKLKPIGYQAWVDKDHVAVFVLGDAATRSPASLQLVDIRDESSIPIATGIGRALQPVPARGPARGPASVSFTRRDPANIRWIDVYDVASRKISHAAKSLAQNEYHIWMPDGLLVSAQGSQLFQIRPGKDADWTMIADLADRGIKGITRLAVSPDGKMIAVVAAH